MGPDEQYREEQWLVGLREQADVHELFADRDRASNGFVSRDEERQLLRFVGEGRALEDSQGLGTRLLRARAAAARSRLVRAYLPFVREIASGYRGGGLAFDDLVQEGCLALFRAIDKFDLTQQVRLSSFAELRIRAHMQRAVDRSCNIVRLPYRTSIWIRKVLRTIDGMNEAGAHFINRDAISTSDLQAIAWHLSDPDGRHVTPGEVSAWLQLAQNPTVSVDQPIGSNGRTLLDSLQLRAIEENGELDSVIAEAMLSLSEMEQQVLTLRFGLGNQEEQTLEEVGRRFHCSAEWIRKTEKKALTKLRTAVATAASAKPSQQRHWGR